jgi:hypothetical protein
MIQILSDATQLHGRPIAFQRLVASQMIREDEPLSAYGSLPPPPPPPALRSHPKAPHLRLVVSHNKPAAAHFDADEILARMFDVFGAGLTAS